MTVDLVEKLSAAAAEYSLWEVRATEAEALGRILAVEVERWVEEIRARRATAPAVDRKANIAKDYKLEKARRVEDLALVEHWM